MAGQGTAAAGDGVGHEFPQFDPTHMSSRSTRFVASSKSPLEDKVAIAPNMQYHEDKRREWVKTTSNYSISKAFGMSALLPWAESAQSSIITDAHVLAMNDSEFCADHEPPTFSRDLWGYLTLLALKAGPSQKARASQIAIYFFVFKIELQLSD